MKMIVLAPLAFVAACASDAPPSAGADIPQPADEPVNAAPMLSGSYTYEPEECVDHSVSFRAHLAYSDGSSTANVSCLYQFPDGSAVEGCGVTHPVPDLGPVVLVMHDNVNGETATYTDIVQGPASFSLSVDVTTAGDTLTWHAHSLYGAAVNTADLVVYITPAANVVETDPSLFHQFDGTVHLTADGTYTVTVNGAVNFAEFNACGLFATASVAVDCNGSSTGSGSGSGIDPGN